MAFSQYVIDSYWLHREKQLRMSALGRWNGILYFVPLVVLGVSELAPGVGAWDELMGWLCWALVVSTVASIVDRGLAPRPGSGATFAAAVADETRAETNKEAAG